MRNKFAQNLRAASSAYHSPMALALGQIVRYRSFKSCKDDITDYAVPSGLCLFICFSPKAKAIGLSYTVALRLKWNENISK